MQVEQSASIGDLLSSKPLVPSFPSKPCWTDMQSLVMSQSDCNGCAPPEGKRACLALLLYGQRESVDEACQCRSWEVWCKIVDDHTEALKWQQPPVLQDEKPAPLPVCGGMAPEQSGMQASARPRSVSPQAAAWPRYLLQWVDQEPILFVAHIGISASNLHSTDSSKSSFLFEQTDLCFSLWRFVCHTNWLCLPLAATVFSRKRLCLNLQLGNSALANTFRKKCTYCYWKAADSIFWRSFVQSLSFFLLFLSPTEIYSSKFSHPIHTYTETQ